VVRRILFLPLCLLMDIPAIAADVSNGVTYTIQTAAGSSSVGDGGPALAGLFSQTEGIAVD
jgi:hypothetical protein